MKTFIKFFLSITLLIIFSTTVNASSPASYTITGSDEVKYQDEVSYKLVVREGTLFSDMLEYILDYDSTKLQYVSFNSAYGVTLEEPTKKLVFPAGGLQVTVGQEIGTIYFRVLSNEVGSTIKLVDKTIKIIETPKANDDTKNNDTDNNNNGKSSVSDDTKLYIVIACLGTLSITLLVTLAVVLSRNKK